MQPEYIKDATAEFALDGALTYRYFQALKMGSRMLMSYSRRAWAD